MSHFTFYTDKFVRSGSAGVMRVFLLPCIFIRPANKGDEGLLAHELVHVKQAWGNIFPPIWQIRYNLSKSYRLKCEVEAYRVQLQHNPDKLDLYAWFIANEYNLDITAQAAAELLKA